MIDALISFFIRKQTREKFESPEHTDKLKQIWENLDEDLKDFALTSRNLGLAHNLKVKFNERGMAELILQLHDIGYEIQKKDNEDERSFD